MITNLLFDLGGVIMDIRKNNCIEAFKNLGLKDPSQYLGEFSQKGPFGQLEEGLITPADFHEFVRSQLTVEVTDEQIDQAFNKFLVGIPVQRLRDLQTLRQQYGIYMLSNTNAIMWDSRIAEEFTKDGLVREAYFDGIVTSFTAKALKPDPRIFEYAIEHLHIDPTQTLFLDDSEANLRGAEALGFRTAHVPEGKEFMQILKEMDLA